MAASNKRKFAICIALKTHRTLDFEETKKSAELLEKYKHQNFIS